MRVLLAGASGDLGQHAVAQLRSAGHDVIGVTQKAGALDGSGAFEVVADILDRARFLQAVSLLEFDAVVQAATRPSHFTTFVGGMIRTNRLRSEGTSALLAAARAAGAKKVVTVSSFAGYGLGDLGDDALAERTPFGQQYGGAIDAVQAALLSNEQQVRAFGGVALRLGLLYGSTDNSAVANDWNRPLPLLHVADAAASIVSALRSGKPGQVYNIADDVPTSWRELHESQSVVMGARFPAGVPSWTIRAGAPFAGQLLTRTSMRLDTALARRELRWKPTYASFAEGLGRALAV